MNIWNKTAWKVFYGDEIKRRGLRVRFDSGVDDEVKRACKDFISWLRLRYVFPKRIRLYIKRDRRIKCKYSQEIACGVFFRPADRNIEPYIKIATGDYIELVQKYGVDNALAKILWSIAHELTHYFQWLNDLDLTFIGEERQATNYANIILAEYAQTREHP